MGQTRQTDAFGGVPRRSPRADDDGLTQQLHRIRSVRLIQRVSLRSAARRMRQNVSQTRAEEDETADLSLSTLLRWQRALNVPISELLVESEGPLSEPIQKRANLVKLMKTARTIAELGGSSRAMRLTERLIDQLTEIMPDLRDVTAWPTNGPRQRTDSVGQIAEHPFPDHLLMDSSKV
jgi:transcriptional regulator with XRE-family HTH domain